MHKVYPWIFITPICTTPCTKMHTASNFRATSLLILVALVLVSCTPAQEQGSFITYLGQDTLAAEHFIATGHRIEAAVMLRTPETTLRQYTMELDDAGMMRRLEATVRDPASPEAPPLRKDLLQATPEGFTLTVTEQEETSTQTIEASPAALPFIDMIHWPFELMLKRGYLSDDAPFVQPLLVGTNEMPFELQKLSADSMTVKHPFRGTMGVTVDAAGRLERLDAANTTRKLRVVRTSNVDVPALARQFAERDAAGQAFGPLSGRGQAMTTVHGATIKVDYGQPARRGREIFGRLVPYGQVWRTGANRATHFETDRPLQFGDLEVPAGAYTLFTILEADGGLLIINRQTGQGGTTYNEDQDLGRIPMQVEQLDTPVEIFTIAVSESGQQGVLQLIWDRTALTVPFTVK